MSPNLLEHFKQTHPNSSCTFDLYQCKYCQLVSTSSAILIEHATLAHLGKEGKEAKNLTLHYSAFHGIKNVAPAQMALIKRLSTTRHFRVGLLRHQIEG
ncbi:unnamed protein product [Protopolystoma xenopodis]|uniref:Uncharacterized protein n=1 Tax=Protopolystoma xenopodis TaxID=117903 RepID=A0A3S5AR40_9PLAT|nr:unnamed protein product [Protopolystoma xenopodis]